VLAHKLLGESIVGSNLGGEAGIVYSLLLSLIYRLVLKTVEGKLSSVKGFLAVYIASTYTPIIVYLASISVFISSMVLAASAVFLYAIISSNNPLLARVSHAGIGLLDLSMIASAVASASLLALKLWS